MGKVREEDQMPEISPFEFYIEAFKELSSCRNSGMSLGPIPFSAIWDYHIIYGVKDFEEFLYLIRQMDDEILRINAKESDGKVNTSKRNQNPGGRQNRGRT